MALTKDFAETVRARAQRDPRYRRALLREALEALLSEDLDTAKGLLRDYINATVGFAALAKAIGVPSKSLMRMLGPRGNPQASNLFTLIRGLLRWERVVINLQLRKVS